MNLYLVNWNDPTDHESHLHSWAHIYLRYSVNFDRAFLCTFSALAGLIWMYSNILQSWKFLIDMRLNVSMAVLLFLYLVAFSIKLTINNNSYW